MLEPLSGTPRRMDVGFVPSPTGGEMHFWQNEEGHNAYLVVFGWAPDLDSPERTETWALITGVGCFQSVFGYPNEEAFWKDPRGGLGHGCFEIIESDWAARLDYHNLHSFGKDMKWRTSLNHYFIGSKDGSCQMLARDLTCEVFPGASFEAVLKDSRERAQWRPPPTPEELQANQRYRAAVRERYGHPPGTE